MDQFGNTRTPNPPPGQSGFNSYAAGNRYYDGGRNAPNVGSVSGMGLLGYAQRDAAMRARKDAIMRRLQGQSTGNPMNQNVTASSYIGVS